MSENYTGFKRINVSIDQDGAIALQSLIDQVNAQRQAKGLDAVSMRSIISSCAVRIRAMDTVFLCGELLKKGENNGAGSVDVKAS